MIPQSPQAFSQAIIRNIKDLQLLLEVTPT